MTLKYDCPQWILLSQEEEQNINLISFSGLRLSCNSIYRDMPYQTIIVCKFPRVALLITYGSGDTQRAVLAISNRLFSCLCDIYF